MKEVIILYSTDAWHSKSSRQIVGVFSDRETLDEYIYKMKRKEKLSNDDLAMLNREDQTQGRDENFLIETEKINPNYEHRK